MKAKKKIVIITDNSAVTRGIAENIKAVFDGAQFANWSPKVIGAQEFIATEILPAHAFIIGTEKPESPDFAHVKELFQHINLAGRPCGVFSSQTSSIKYLAGLVRDSEAALGSPLVAKNGLAGKRELQKWVKGILGDKA